ncbi:TetR/AcrR family transcriptional regulator [Tessaracoccus flavus]|nr:TetR/AcrR family transcriptional regulator [Tessaracoccus flavus]SDY84296.1 transcriptional regulator, TetR family [Tessaracoccus flavus]
MAFRQLARYCAAMARTDRTPRTRMAADARRDDILAGAAAAFRARPYADVRVADVAEGVGASPALVYRYFTSKAGLYAAVVQAADDALASQQRSAVASLPTGSPPRDKVRALLEAYLDHVAADPTSWTNPFLAGDEPPEALAVREEGRLRHVADLRASLGLTPDAWARHEMSLHGYLGFVDQACLRWANSECSPDLRWAVIEASLGALEGALGDWRV